MYDKASWFLVGIGMLFGLYGIGSYFQKPSVPSSFVSSSIAVSNKPNEVLPPRSVAQVPALNDVQTAAKMPASAPDLKTKPKVAPISDTLAEEKVYFCGAPTKKGTMCSRRVKNGGRCWQHEGKEAMAAQEKLLIVQ